MKYIIIFALLVYSFESFAQDRVRAKVQRHKIREGVKSGELTKEEAKELRQDQRQIRKQKREAMKDGVVTKEERKEIREERNEAAKEIYQEKHD